MSRDTSYNKQLYRLSREIDQRSERLAAAWRRILPLLDPLELRFAELERHEREAALDDELHRLRRGIAEEQ